MQPKVHVKAHCETFHYCAFNAHCNWLHAIVQVVGVWSIRRYSPICMSRTFCLQQFNNCDYYYLLSAVCSFTYSQKDEIQALSEDYQLKGYKQCEFHIRAPRNNFIELNFTQFFGFRSLSSMTTGNLHTEHLLDYNSDECLPPEIVVKGKNSSEKQIGRICTNSHNFENPKVFHSKLNVVNITYIWLKNHSSGFTVEFDFHHYNCKYLFIYTIYTVSSQHICACMSKMKYFARDLCARRCPCIYYIFTYRLPSRNLCFGFEWRRLSAQDGVVVIPVCSLVACIDSKNTPMLTIISLFWAAACIIIILICLSAFLSLICQRRRNWMYCRWSTCLRSQFC